MTPSIDTWYTIIYPAVFVPVIIILFIFYSILTIGILLQKKARTNITKLSIINLGVASLLQAGLWLMQMVIYGLRDFKKKAYDNPNCDVYTMSFWVLHSVGATIALEIILLKLVETIGRNENEKQDKSSKKCFTYFNNPIAGTIIILFPWIFAVVICVALVSFPNEDVHDCYLKVVYENMWIRDGVSFFFPVFLSILLCIVGTFYLCFTSQKNVAATLLPYIIGVLMFVTMSVVNTLTNDILCDKIQNGEYEGCHLTPSEKHNIILPLMLVNGLSYLALPTALLFSESIRKCLATALLAPSKCLQG